MVIVALLAGREKPRIPERMRSVLLLLALATGGVLVVGGLARRPDLPTATPAGASEVDRSLPWQRLSGAGAQVAVAPEPARAPTSSGSDSAPDSVRVWLAARARTDLGLAPRTELRLATVGTDGLVRSDRLAVVDHAVDAVVRVEPVPGLGLAVVADEQSGRRTFGAALSFVSSSTRRLAAGVVTGSRPLAGPDGRIYVERGAEGDWPSRDEARRGLLRVDALEIDAVDPRSGDVRVVTTWQGYAIHLAGALGDDLVVYRVGPRGAEIARVDRASGQTRVVADVAPFARDFTVDAPRRALVFSNRDPADASRWVVERLDVDTGATTTLASAADEAPIPFALEGGPVLVQSRVLRARARTLAPSALSPLPGAATATPRFATRARRDGSWISISTVGGRDARFDRTTLYASRSGREIDLSSNDERIELVGFEDEPSAGGLR